MRLSAIIHTSKSTTKKYYMRIIEPQHNRKKKNTFRSKKRSFARPVVLTGLILVIATLFLSLGNSYRKTALQRANQTGTLSSSEVAKSDQVAGVSDSSLKYFTPEQFQTLYEGIVFPNTQSIETKPAITGNQAVDNRIRTIAESRGYVYRSTPKLPITKTSSFGPDEKLLLQPKTAQAFAILKANANSENIPLILNSGYRSVEEQKTLFVDRLNQTGASAENMAAGKADELIVSVLSTTAPPGYSRHHTGYTVDLVCDDGLNRPFKETPCFEWIKKDNYANSKKTGFVPSYPEGIDNQGPEPEPWEYVWVGIGALQEQ